MSSPSCVTKRRRVLFWLKGPLMAPLLGTEEADWRALTPAPQYQSVVSSDAYRAVITDAALGKPY